MSAETTTTTTTTTGVEQCADALQHETRDLPEIESPTLPSIVYMAALALLAAGFSFMPISADGSKSPDWRLLPIAWDQMNRKWRRTWKPLQMRRPTPAQVNDWFHPDRHTDGACPGVGIIAGAVSGGAPGFGLEIIDIDSVADAEPFERLVEEREPGLWSRLPRVISPRPGMHLYFRCPIWGSSEKLASAPEMDTHGQPSIDSTTKRPRVMTLIEIKGEGGYCLAPPSSGACHPSGKPYELASDSPPLTAVPTITPAQRTILRQAARLLNRYVDAQIPISPRRASKGKGDGDRPGDDFNRRGSWEEILLPHGWRPIGNNGGITFWCRPGKENGISATTNFSDLDLFHCFSTNAAPFEPDRSYTKFGALALLDHGGNWSAAAHALQKRGFGTAPIQAQAEVER